MATSASSVSVLHIHKELPLQTEIEVITSKEREGKSNQKLAELFGIG